MKKAGEQLLEIYDWLAPFYEKALPKSNPKITTESSMAHAAVMAYDKDPSDVPARFNGGFHKGISRHEKRKLIIHRIKEFGVKNAPKLERYMAEEYDVLVVWHDGDPRSRGKRIITNSERQQNVDAATSQSKWDKAHCHGTHAREDYNSEQIARLQPKVEIERHKLVNVRLAKGSGWESKTLKVDKDGKSI